MNEEPLSAGPTRRAGWLLVLTLPAFIAYLALAVATIAEKADSSSAELTAGDISDLGVGWIAVQVLWMVPSVLAAWGLAELARRADLPHAAAVRVLGGIALCLVAAYVAVQTLAFGIDDGTWGDSGLFAVSVVLSLAVGWAATLPATIVVAVELRRRGVARRTMTVLAVLVGAYLVLEVVVYLPALVGSESFADTVGVPPFLLGLFWAVLGGTVIRPGAHFPHDRRDRRVPARHGDRD